MAILDIGRDSHYSVGARRTSSLYLSAGDARGANKANVGPSLLDRIEDALEQAGGDPARASEISGIAEREIARIKALMAWAVAGTEEEVRETRKAAARDRKGKAAARDRKGKAAARDRKGMDQRPVTDADVAQLLSTVATHGTFGRAGLALGWSNWRLWRVHSRGLKTGAIARKRGRR